jgi:hypothetical protein
MKEKLEGEWMLRAKSCSHYRILGGKVVEPDITVIAAAWVAPKPS